MIHFRKMKSFLINTDIYCEGRECLKCHPFLYFTISDWIPLKIPKMKEGFCTGALCWTVTIALRQISIKLMSAMRWKSSTSWKVAQRNTMFINLPAGCRIGLAIGELTHDEMNRKFTRIFISVTIRWNQRSSDNCYKRKSDCFEGYLFLKSQVEAKVRV